MATLDFSRVEEGYLNYDSGMTFDAVIDFTRSDEVSVDFSGKTILFKVYNDEDRGTALETLTSGAEITISTAELTFSYTFTALNLRAYWYLLYNDTDDIAIRQGWLVPL